MSDTSVDIAMLLRDMMMPLPMRDGWGPEMEWPYPGVPAAVVAEFAGHRVAGLPFFAPETVTTDHGGRSIRTSTRRRPSGRWAATSCRPGCCGPTDKAACERAFGAMRSLLFEHLPGYTGIDVADRGADPEADATLTMTQMEHLVATWIVSVWQNRALGRARPGLGPGRGAQPEHAVRRRDGPGRVRAAGPPAGAVLRAAARPPREDPRRPRGEDRRALVRRADPALKPYDGKPSGRGGEHKGAWVIRDDRRDRRQVFFQDPADPAEMARPALERAAGRWARFPRSRTRPRTSCSARPAPPGCRRNPTPSLLPVLLELLGGVAPVSQWPTQMSKKEKKGQAREAAQGDQAASGQARPGARRRPAAAGGQWFRCAGRTRRPQARDAIDAERRRRREQAVPQRPAPPGALGDRLRATSLLALPDEDEE